MYGKGGQIANFPFLLQLPKDLHHRFVHRPNLRDPEFVSVGISSLEVLQYRDAIRVQLCQGAFHQAPEFGRVEFAAVVEIGHPRRWSSFRLGWSFNTFPRAQRVP